MNPRAFIPVLGKRTRLFMGVVLAVALGYALFHGCRRNASDPAGQGASSPFGYLPQSITRKTVPLQPAPKTPEPAPLASPPKPVTPEPLPSISLYAAGPVQVTEPAPPTEYAPFGRLIPCVLIVTVDSALIATPIIGMVTEDVWHAGQLIIPAGAEVHGRAQLDRSRERIASQGPWTIVWVGGEELTLSGIALDQERLPDLNRWDIRDGTAGLWGEVIRVDNSAEVKLFFGTALAAAAEAFEDRQTTLLGPQALPTVKNAALAGAGQVLDLYAQRLLDTLLRDGIYVRVPAGKQFYLYVTETIDLSKARVASTRHQPATRFDPAPSPSAGAPWAASSPSTSPFTPRLNQPIKP